MKEGAPRPVMPAVAMEKGPSLGVVSVVREVRPLVRVSTEKPSTAERSFVREPLTDGAKEVTIFRKDSLSQVPERANGVNVIARPVPETPINPEVIEYLFLDEEEKKKRLQNMKKHNWVKSALTSIKMFFTSIFTDYTKEEKKESYPSGVISATSR